MTGSTGHTRPKPQVLVSMSHNSRKPRPRRVPAGAKPEPIWIGMRDLEIAPAYGSANHYPPALLRTACIKAAVSQTSGLFRQDSTVLDGTGALARASNKPLYAFALLWMSYSVSFGDSDTGRNIWGLVRDPFNWEE